jgi:hypothetical protein
METLREKITFIITGLVYLLFHLRMGQDAGAIINGTFAQILLTAPYSIGFTYLIIVFIRYASGGTWPAWDRIARIFFTLGILFAFFFALYEYGSKEKMPLLGGDVIELHFSLHDTRMVKLYSA